MSLIHTLLDRDCFDHDTGHIELIETHISWVILTGPYAYKLKKPVDLGFLDFSTLEKRRFYCQEELRLNRRLAPSIYLDVVSVCADRSKPYINGCDDAIEYAVKMKQFDQAAQLDRMLERHGLGNQHIDAFAGLIGRFHQQTAIAAQNTPLGNAQHVFQPVEENFSQIRERIHNQDDLEKLSSLEDWSRISYNQLQALLEQRKQDGFIRECHGDLHLRNLAWVDDEPVAFDCIEFNDHLRWCDVINEIAFLVMDLLDRQQQALAYRFLNTYLELTGDYAGVRVLLFYLVYRAMVRAKVAAIRYSQTGITANEQQAARDDFHQYLDLAQSFTQAPAPMLVVTHGLSGSGKTTYSQQILENLPAIRLRSDVERKRLFGMTAKQRGGGDISQGIYTKAASEQTYRHLLQQAGKLLDAGFNVIVDAAFLAVEQRQPFQELAEQRQLPYRIVSLSASPEQLRARLSQRRGDASDAGLLVLEHQLARQTPLLDSEQASVVFVDTENPPDTAQLIMMLKNQSNP